MSRKSGKTKFSMSKMGRVPFRKKFKKGVKFNTDQRGLWPTHQYIRTDDPVNEMNIKNSLCPDGGIDVTKIDNMVEGVLSRDDDLLRRYHDGETLTKIDTMRVENLLSKINSNIQRDIEGITKSRFNHKPITPEGSFMIKMLWLERFMSKNLKEKIAHIYLKIKDDEDNLETLKLPDNLKVKYRKMLSDLNSLIETYDMIDLQLGPLSNSVTPLNQKGFKKLEDFQVRVIQLIQENEKLDVSKKKSILVKAPTSAGKTALAGYLFTKKGRFIVSVPTNALAWQLAAMISKIMSINVPLVTDTYQSALKTSDLVNLIIKNRCVVGTPAELVNILGRPEFEEITFDWMMLDEIHMLGKKEGAWMEALIKAYPETPVLALSATIGNEVELADWIKNCNRDKVEVVVYEKRFINLQRFVYNDSDDKIIRINPLAMVSLEDFISGEVLKKTIVPTPQDAYMIYQILREKYPDEEHLFHENFFDIGQRLSLDDILRFFNHHLKFMTQKVQEKDTVMKGIIEDLQLNDFESSSVNLVDVLFTLKEEKKCPAIVFHKNSSIIMDYAYKIHHEVSRRETEKYPKLMIERLKHNKKFKQQQKKDDKDDTMKKINDSKSDSSKIEIKMQKKLAEMQASGKAEERITEKDIFEPHRDFIFTQHQYNSKAIVENWEYNVNPNKDKFFPRDGDCWHWVLMLLYRGLGIYCKGLPDPYLRIVQQMANDKKLAVVLSDKELVFGVSMPFRTAVILNDDSLDSMEYHQMAGRAGRRGLDKEGNVVFVGQSSSRIRDLSISMIPNVTGSTDCLHYGMKVVQKLSKSSRWNHLSSNMLVSKSIDEEEVNDFFEGISENQSEGGIWDYVDSVNNTHLLYLMWQFRQTDECIMLPLILKHLESGFARARSTDEGDQVSVAHYLLHFIEVKESDGNPLPPHPLVLDEHKNFYESMKDDEEGYAFDISDNIDGSLYYCIRENRCIPTNSIMEKHHLRERLSRFIYKLRAIQHYYYHMSFEKTNLKGRHINICKLLGKLFTRLKWIYHMSSMLAEK